MLAGSDKVEWNVIGRILLPWTHMKLPYNTCWENASSTEKYKAMANPGPTLKNANVGKILYWCVAADCKLPLATARVLSVASRANARSLHAL